MAGYQASSAETLATAMLIVFGNIALIVRKCYSLVSKTYPMRWILSALTPAVLADNSRPFQPISLEDASADTNMSVANMTGWFFMDKWNLRGDLIRSGGTLESCLGNLSYALESLGPLQQSEYSGAASALCLLPTAGALLGAPTKEMWIVWKLMPIAGLLSMFLSLGGSLMPSKVEDYQASSSASYMSLMSTSQRVKSEEMVIEHREMEALSIDERARRFSENVRSRALSSSGGDSYSKVWIGVLFQTTLIACVLVAMWYCQKGSVIPWWCKVWGWMYFWFFLVAIVSIIDNIVAAPFSQTWTMRVSKAPDNILLSDATPGLRNTDERLEDPGEGGTSSSSHNPNETALDKIERGLNVKNRVTIDPLHPSTASRTCFYVIISENKIKGWHVALQIVSKAFNVAVFAFGTALFGAATLLSISAALMLLCTVLACGVMGRVAAMWMALEMNQHNKPILDAVVNNKTDAAKYFQQIIDIDGIVVEINGHVLMNGRCVLRRGKWWSWSHFPWATYIGLLAAPFDVVRFATSHTASAGPFSGFNSSADIGLGSSGNSVELGEVSSTGRSRRGFQRVSSNPIM